MRKLSYRSQNQRKKSLKYGGYATITTLVVLAILVLVNVFFDKLDITVDLSSEKLYTPGDQTLEILDGMEDDVIIYGFYNTGTEETELNSKVILLIDAYCDLSDHVSYKRVDPLLEPAFANQFLQDESQSIDNGSLIVQNTRTGKFKTVTTTNMYETTDDYVTLTRTVTGFSAEEALTSAIQYVTMAETPTLVQLQGHGEGQLASGFVEYLSASNFEVTTLNLTTENISEIEIEKAKIIVVNAPVTDLSEAEYETLLAYMEHGGHMLFLAEYDTPDLTNFNRLLSRYGLSIQTGLMIETDNSYYYQYPSIILPILATNNDITKYLLNDSNNYVLMTLPAAVNISSEISNKIKVTSLVTTSDGAVIKADGNSAVVAEDGDLIGPFNLAVTAEEQVTIDDTGVATSKICVIGNSQFLDSYATTGNYKLTTIICDYLQDSTTSLYISTKSLEENKISTSDADFFTWGAIFVIIIPALILGAGLAIYLRRRHR